MVAYNVNYLNDVADLQEQLFQEVTRYKFEVDYEKFVENYMKCKYRTLLDSGNARVANMTWDELLCYLERDCNEIFIPGETTIDRLQAGWIGRMYTLIQHRQNISSQAVYDKLPFDRMRTLFIPLHTVSEDIALSKLLVNFE